MLGWLFTFLIFGMTLSGGEPIVNLPLHTVQPVNAIRKIFYQLPEVNAERKALGLEPVINLSIGQPHIPMQMRVIDAFIGYLESLKTLPPEQLCVDMGYSHSAGTDETRAWISRFFTKSFPEVKEGFKPEEVMVTNGATGALTNALHVLLDEGDEVAVFAPYFAAYENQVKSCRGRLIAIPFLLGRSNADLLDDCLSSHPKVKALIWNDPNNPLGTKATERELLELANVIQKHPNLIVIHDETYKDIIHEGSHLSLMNVAPALKARSFIIRSLAKDILGAPGIRAGLIAAPIDTQTTRGDRVNFIDLMSNAQLRDITSVSVLVQKMLVFALEQNLSGVSEEWGHTTSREYAENTSTVIKALAELGLHPLVVPKGAFYVMIDASPLLGKSIPNTVGPIGNLRTKLGKNVIQNDVDVVAFFLHAAGVAMVPGSGFGTDHCTFRISCSKPKGELVKAIKRVKEAIETLEMADLPGENS